MTIGAFVAIATMIFFHNPARRDKFANWASNTGANIECYSGGKLIYRGGSIGKPVSEQNSDGYSFREDGSQALIEVSGNCVIRYNQEKKL